VRAFILVAEYGIDIMGLDEPKALQHAALVMQLGTAACGTHRLREIWDKSMEHEKNMATEVYEAVDAEIAERKSKLMPNRPDARVTVPRSFYPSIVAKAAEWTGMAIRMSGPRLQAWLTDQGYKVSVQCARTLINDVLHKKFGKYNKAKRDWVDRTAAKTTFIIKYSHCLKEQREGKIVLVYWDESYIHTNHDVGHGWGDEIHGNGRGQRLILSHAMTKDGLVCGVKGGKPGIKGVNSRMPLRQPVMGRSGGDCTPAGAGPLSAEWVWQASAKIRDYHQNMNDETCAYWFEQMLIAALNEMYADDDTIVGFVHVLDNAPYHKAAAPGCIPIRTITKKAMEESKHASIPDEVIDAKKRAAHGKKYNQGEDGKDICQSVGLVEFTVVREPQPADYHAITNQTGRKRAKAGGTFTFKHADGDFWKSAPKGPSVEELREALHAKILLARPDLLMSRLQQICAKTRSQAAAPGGGRKFWHDMLFTVPYDATSQPAELLWQMSKGRTGGVWYPGRSLKIVHEQWLTALYGGAVPLGIVAEDMTDRLTKTFAPIDAMQCTRFIRKCHRHMGEFLDEQDSTCGDTVDNMHTKKDFSTLKECLQWSNLDAAEVETQDDGAEREGVGEEGSD
jgi:hypothetical protein